MIATTSTDPEEKARELQLELWDRQCTLWPGEKVTPLDVCDPWVAAQHLGFEVQEGWLSSPGTRAGYELGGFLNRPANLIGISDQQKPRTKLFTLAHEVGHLVMHPGLHHHREMPIHGMTEPREPTDPREREANHFAGCFLVPKKQLRRAFQAAFGAESLKLTDNTAWELLGANFTSLMNSPYNSLAFERVVAQALRFRGRHFGSLCNLFQVSATTMAIRLRQAALVYR
jgi:IrrE N-terminal-like domain